MQSGEGALGDASAALTRSSPGASTASRLADCLALSFPGPDDEGLAGIAANRKEVERKQDVAETRDVDQECAGVPAMGPEAFVRVPSDALISDVRAQAVAKCTYRRTAGAATGTRGGCAHNGRCAH